MAYIITFGDARFTADNFRIVADTAIAQGQRGARDTTAMTIEVSAPSNNTYMPADARIALFNYSFRPQYQEFRTLTAEVEEIAKPGSILCTYTFQRAWITMYREGQPPGRPDLQITVKFRGLFSEDPTREVTVEP